MKDSSDRFHELQAPEPERSRGYQLDEQVKQDLGEQKKRFEEWESLGFDGFLANPNFRSAEAVIAFFLDHPKANPTDQLLSLDQGRYGDFVKTFFGGKIELPADKLAAKIVDVVHQIAEARSKLAQTTEIINELSKRAMDTYANPGKHSYIPSFEINRLLFVPSVDVYNYLVSGISTASAIRNGFRSNGSASTPVAGWFSDKNAIASRVAFVPMSFSLVVHGEELEISQGNNMSQPGDIDFQKNWGELALKSALHESEHARVSGHLDYQGDEAQFGFKTLQLKYNSLPTKSNQERVEEKSNDEGATDFFTIWKLLVFKGILTPESSFEDIISEVDKSYLSLSGYSREVRLLLDRMKKSKERSPQSDPIKYLIMSYYTSSSYPFST